MTAASLIRESAEGVTFAVKVIPRAAKNEIVGLEGEAFKIRLNAPPVEGKANEALVEYLAKVLSVKRADVEILRGETSRHKVVQVRGVEVEHVRQRLLAPAA